MNSDEIKSFVATLECLTPGFGAAIVCKQDDGFAGGGWLVCAKNNEAPTPLRFDYLEHTENRVHFNISAAAHAGVYAGARLGVSRNGYLGLYSLSTVTDFWKVERIGELGNDRVWRFILRDHLGHQVKALAEVDPKANVRNPDTPQSILARTYHYLHYAQGEIVEFQARVSSVIA